MHRSRPTTPPAVSTSRSGRHGPRAASAPTCRIGWRWLAADRAPATCEAAKWRGLPAGACGALVFGWHRLDAAPSVKGGAAVALLAVNEAGERVSWFGARAVAVRTIGSCTGAVFEARIGESTDPVHVAEREIDTLALASSPRYGPGRILAAGSGLQTIAEALSAAAGGVVVHAHGYEAGPLAAIETGRVRIEPYGPGESPASTLAGDLGERAGIFEHCGGLTGAEAERLAWTALLERVPPSRPAAAVRGDPSREVDP